MRAAIMRDWNLQVGDVPDPVPGDGQALTKVLACGICGSDLHTLEAGDEGYRILKDSLLSSMVVEADGAEPAAAGSGEPSAMDLLSSAQFFDPAGDVVMGHEYACEVVELGPGCDAFTVGDVIVGVPILVDLSGLHMIGSSNTYPGGYGELMVVDPLTSMVVPQGFDPLLAALTEPLSVGVHAVAMSKIEVGDSAIILGLGPVGLACIAELKVRGIGPIIAADFSPKRRQIAEAMGADVVVDPAEMAPREAWQKVAGGKPLVIFEAVGSPGMIDRAIRMAPRGSRLLVVGACYHEDTFTPMMAIGRELNIQFSFGYEPHEFASALESITTGRVKIDSWITGTVDVAGVPGAFRDLTDPATHAKIMVAPS